MRPGIGGCRKTKLNARQARIGVVLLVLFLSQLACTQGYISPLDLTATVMFAQTATPDIFAHATLEPQPADPEPSATLPVLEITPADVPPEPSNSQATPVETDTPMPTPRPTETPLPQPTEIGWTLRFADDFSDPASGWPVMKDDPDVVKEYADGGYLVTLIKDNIDTFTRNTYAEVLSDVRVEVDALRIGDQTPWDIGLACRIDGMAVYQLSVYESNGVKKYGIYRWNEESYITLAEKIVTDNRVFREGKIANQFRADCVGDHLTLWINGEKVLEATDPNPLPRGKAGLVAGYADGVQVFYDNFAVYIP